MVLTFLLQLALLLLCPVAILIVFVHRHRKHWHSRGIPSPTPTLISGNFGSLFGARPSIFQLKDWTDQYGKVYGIQYGWRNALVISDPAMAHELLATKFEHFHERNLSPALGHLDSYKWINMFAARGSRWKRLRMTANPAFSVTNLKRSILTIDDSVKHAINFLEEARNRGHSINIHRHFVELTFDVIARTALGQRESQQFRTEMASLAIGTLQRYNNTLFDYIAFAFPWVGLHFVHPFIDWTGFLRNDPVSNLKNQLMNEVMERKKQRQEGQKEAAAAADFIDMFLETEQNQQQQQHDDGEEVLSKTAHSKIEKSSTTEEIAMQLMALLVAGFDTTANSLSLVSRALALHPGVQAKVHEEIESICIDEDPTYEQLSQLKYTEAVVKETLRLLPIASNVVNRICCQTTTLGHFTVEKGTAIHLDVISLHRDKSAWGEDAGEFRPERWLDKGRQLPPFYSFGGGPRICIGMRFALIEEKLALIRLLRKYSIVRCADTEKELEFTGQAVICPKSVTVGLKLREGDDDQQR